MPPLKIGRRTGRNVVPVKNIRKDKNGKDCFDDYFSDDEVSSSSSSNESEYKASGVQHKEKSTSNASRVLTENNLGRRTGVDILKGKNVRVHEDGTQVYNDYFSETDDSFLSRPSSKRTTLGDNLAEESVGYHGKNPSRGSKIGENQPSRRSGVDRGDDSYFTQASSKHTTLHDCEMRDQSCNTSSILYRNSTRISNRNSSFKPPPHSPVFTESPNTPSPKRVLFHKDTGNEYDIHPVEVNENISPKNSTLKSPRILKKSALQISNKSLRSSPRKSSRTSSFEPPKINRQSNYESSEEEFNKAEGNEIASSSLRRKTASKSSNYNSSENPPQIEERNISKSHSSTTKSYNKSSIETSKMNMQSNYESSEIEKEFDKVEENEIASSSVINRTASFRSKYNSSEYPPQTENSLVQSPVKSLCSSPRKSSRTSLFEPPKINRQSNSESFANEEEFNKVEGNDIAPGSIRRRSAIIRSNYNSSENPPQMEETNISKSRSSTRKSYHKSLNETSKMNTQSNYESSAIEEEFDKVEKKEIVSSSLRNRISSFRSNSSKYPPKTEKGNIAKLRSSPRKRSHKSSFETSNINEGSGNEPSAIEEETALDSSRNRTASFRSSPRKRQSIHNSAKSSKRKVKLIDEDFAIDEEYNTAHKSEVENFNNNDPYISSSPRKNLQASIPRELSSSEYKNLVNDNGLNEVRTNEKAAVSFKNKSSRKSFQKSIPMQSKSNENLGNEEDPSEVETEKIEDQASDYRAVLIYSNGRNKLFVEYSSEEEENDSSSKVASTTFENESADASCRSLRNRSSRLIKSAKDNHMPNRFEDYSSSDDEMNDSKENEISKRTEDLRRKSMPQNKNSTIKSYRSSPKKRVVSHVEYNSDRALDDIDHQIETDEIGGSNPKKRNTSKTREKIVQSNLKNNSKYIELESEAQNKNSARNSYNFDPESEDIEYPIEPDEVNESKPNKKDKPSKTKKKLVSKSEDNNKHIELEPEAQNKNSTMNFHNSGHESGDIDYQIEPGDVNIPSTEKAKTKKKIVMSNTKSIRKGIEHESESEDIDYQSEPGEVNIPSPDKSKTKKKIEKSNTKNICKGIEQESETQNKNNPINSICSSPRKPTRSSYSDSAFHDIPHTIESDEDTEAKSNESKTKKRPKVSKTKVNSKSNEEPESGNTKIQSRKRSGDKANEGNVGGKKKSKKKHLIDEEVQLRRSKRDRIPPLDHWRGQRMVFAYPRGGEIIKIGIEQGSKDCLERIIPKKPEKKRDTKPKVKKIPIVNKETGKEERLVLHIPYDSLLWDNHKTKASKDSDDEDVGYSISNTFSSPRLSYGCLQINPNSEKPEQRSANHNVQFQLLKGQVKVIINNNEIELARWGSFIVPWGQVYSIRNLLNTRALLSFSISNFPFFPNESEDIESDH